MTKVGDKEEADGPGDNDGAEDEYGNEKADEKGRMDF